MWEVCGVLCAACGEEGGAEGVCLRRQLDASVQRCVAIGVEKITLLRLGLPLHELAPSKGSGVMNSE